MTRTVVACGCPPGRRRIVVIQRRCNYSAFNGYRRQPSRYSLVRCLTCGCRWRTRGAFADAAPDATPDQT